MKPAIRREAGFSLIELMISITLGLVILAALTTFFVQTSQNRREMDRSTRQIENGRYAIDVLREDTMMAGFFADMVPLAVPTWSTNPPCPTNPADPASLGYSASPTYNSPLPLLTFPDGTGVLSSCVPNMLPGTDVLVLNRFNSESYKVVDAAAALPVDLPNNQQWYVQVSSCVDDPPSTPFVVNRGDGANFTLRKHNCVDVADLWRLRQSVYYIRDYSAVPGDNIPTLVRRELRILGANAMMDIPLVEGIEKFRVDLGIDNDGNGSPDLWSRCDAGSCTAAQLGNVMAAKIYVLSRNLEASNGWVDNKTYGMGLSGSTTATNDAYKRHVYSAMVSMPNRTGPREPQLKAAP